LKEVLVCGTTIGTTACRPQERNRCGFNGFVNLPAKTKVTAYSNVRETQQQH